MEDSSKETSKRSGKSLKKLPNFEEIANRLGYLSVGIQHSLNQLRNAQREIKDQKITIANFERKLKEKDKTIAEKEEEIKKIEKKLKSYTDKGGTSKVFRKFVEENLNKKEKPDTTEDIIALKEQLDKYINDINQIINELSK
jgi:chromosome segregation ATPase